MYVLGIETSCDETAVAILGSARGLLANNIYSQVAIHKEYGGVVPELASRDHIRKLLPLIQETLSSCDLSLKKDIHAIAYTSGPGLMGALLVGASVARSLGWALKIPTLGVHHMEAHLLAPLLEKQSPQYPYVALLVSGGHTLLVEVKAVGDYKILGESIDDAVGEAFDKVAQMLGMNYPGGPEIQRLAMKGKSSRFNFPRPMTNRPGLDFSFSGLKTHVLNTIRNLPEVNDQDRADIARAFEDAVVDTLVIKSLRALKSVNAKSLVVAGGVGANQRLRENLKTKLKQENATVFYPAPELCTDNAAMVAQVGLLRIQNVNLNETQQSLQITVHPRWSLENL